MILGDLTIAAILQEELDELRGDQRAIADLFSQAPPSVQEQARRYFTDVEHHQISIRQGFTGDPAKNAIISITLAGETEANSPIGGHLLEGGDPENERQALLLNYVGLYRGGVTVDKQAGTINSWVLAGEQPIIVQQFLYTLSSFATLGLLVDAINTDASYEMVVDTDFINRSPLDLQGGKYLFGEVIPVLPSSWDRRSITYFQASWLISSMSSNVNETLYLNAFVKWALLRRRIDLESEGIGGTQLSGGDFEPAAEWLKSFPNVFVRGVMLSGLYAAEYVERTPMLEVKHADIHLQVPPSYLE